MIESPAPDPTITVLAAMIEGERWPKRTPVPSSWA